MDLPNAPRSRILYTSLIAAQTFPSRIAVLDYSLGTSPDVVEEGDDSLSSQQHLYSLHEILTESGHSPSASSLANSKPEEV